jgi:hypothetical protein
MKLTNNEYEIAVQYEREGNTYYDIYYTIDDNLDEAMVFVKNQ